MLQTFTSQTPVFCLAPVKSISPFSDMISDKYSASSWKLLSLATDIPRPVAVILLLLEFAASWSTLDDGW